MKIPASSFTGIVTGAEVFRVATLCLYSTLLLHVVLGTTARSAVLPNAGVAAVCMLVLLFLGALARYIWPRVIKHGYPQLLAEISIIVLVIVSLMLQESIPALPLPWLIAVAAIFPLAFPARVALTAVLAITAIGVVLNIILGMELIDWLPNMFATLFVGLSAMFLGDALTTNLSAVRESDRNQRRFIAIARATRHVFMITDARLRIKFANPALPEIFGYTQDEIEMHDLKPVVHPNDVEEHKKKMRYLRDTPRSSIFSRHRIKHKNGHWVWLDTRGYNMLHDSAIEGIVLSIEDISARKDAELKLEEEHALLDAVLDMNPSMIYAKDKEGRFTIGNLSFQRRFGYESEDALRGKTIHQLLLRHATSRNLQELQAVATQLHAQDLEIVKSGAPLEDIEAQGLWGTNPRSWYRTNKYPLRNAGGETIGMLGIVSDITDRKEYEMRLEYQALHDALTGLPNRRYLLTAVADAIARQHQVPMRLTMLFCDLDFFKSVNDTHGHDFGDKCLMELTRCIQSRLPAQDFIARFGGDEFVILSNTSLEEAKAKADTLLQSLSLPIAIDGTAIKIQASIGIALLSPEHKNPSDLIRDADAALYQAKERGRNRAEIFDASLQHITTKRAQMDVALRFALERNELCLAYQPKVSVVDGSIKGFELLLRWSNPHYGHIPPIEFIPIAESSGLVIPIGLWVLEQACKQLRIWQTRYPYASDFTIAVNVSMRQLLQSSFLDQVTAVLERTGVSPSSIELEITETSAMANPVQTIENLAMLKRLGLRVVLDDFGTGYSSLSYLQKFPVDVLKIDKDFVKGLGKNPGDLEIVRLILALAQALNLETVAEGVETWEDVIELKKLGCNLAQGFIFSQAVTANDAEEMLRSSQRFLVA